MVTQSVLQSWRARLRRLGGARQWCCSAGSRSVPYDVLPKRKIELFLQPGVLGFGLLINGNIGIGVLPQIQESPVRLPPRGFVAHHLLRAAELEPGQGSRDMSYSKAGIVDQFLELRRGRPPIAELQVRKSADVGGVHVVEPVRPSLSVAGAAAGCFARNRARTLRSHTCASVCTCVLRAWSGKRVGRGIERVSDEIPCK